MEAFAGFFMVLLMLVVLISIRKSDEMDAEDEKQVEENKYTEDDD